MITRTRRWLLLSAIALVCLGGTVRAQTWAADQLLVGDPASQAVYLRLNGQKRLIPDVATLEALGYTLENVRWLTAYALDQMPTGPNLRAYSQGDLLRVEDTGDLWLLAEGKHPLDVATLDAVGWDPGRAKPIPLALAQAIADGEPWPTLRSGDLVRSTKDGCLYLLVGGRHWLPDSFDLAAAGWTDADIINLDADLLDWVPERDVLPTLYAGCLLASTDPDDTRRWILDGGKHLIPDDDTYAAYGWAAERILHLEPYVLEALPEGAPLASVVKGENLFAHGYWGQCTWYVAERRLTPSWRSARYWYRDAKASGFAVGDYPMPGAVVVYGTARGRYGHVAYVEAVYADGSFLLADSNICGWECVRKRLTDLEKEVGVLGFVYWRYD